MAVITLWTALLLALEGPQSSPLMLAVFAAVTVVLGRIAWLQAQR
jgi:hypothetical protein